MNIRGNLPNLGHLLLFDRTASTGSVSQAAVAINRSQPAVTLALRKLEAFVGTELLERGRTGSVPTNAGNILLDRVRRLFAQIDDALLTVLPDARVTEPQTLAAVRAKLSATSISGLIAIADYRSLRDAALALGVSKPSLYRIARDLEQILRCKCFGQGDHGLVANAVGVELARRFSLALKEIDYAREEIGALSGTVHTQIHIGVRRTSILRPLNEAIAEFLRVFPSGHIRVVDEPFDQLLQDLRHGRLDLLYGPIRRPDWAVDLECEALFHRPYMIAVREGHPLATKATVTPHDLAHYDWIVSKKGSPRRRACEHLLQEAGGLPFGSVETSLVEMKASLLTSSDRIALLTSQELQQISPGLLTRIECANIGDRAPDGITTRIDWRPTYPQAMFLDLLRKYGQQMADHHDAETRHDREADDRTLVVAALGMER